MASRFVETGFRPAVKNPVSGTAIVEPRNGQREIWQVQRDRVSRSTGRTDLRNASLLSMAFRSAALIRLPLILPSFITRTLTRSTITGSRSAPLMIVACLPSGRS